MIATKSKIDTILKMIETLECGNSRQISKRKIRDRLVATTICLINRLIGREWMKKVDEEKEGTANKS